VNYFPNVQAFVLQTTYPQTRSAELTTSRFYLVTDHLPKWGRTMYLMNACHKANFGACTFDGAHA